ELPPQALQNAATISLLHLKDDFTMGSFFDTFGTRDDAPPWTVQVVEQAFFPQMIPYLMDLVERKDFTPFEHEPLSLGISSFASEIIIEKVATSEEFSGHTRASARNLGPSLRSKEETADILITWYAHNRDLFAEENFAKIGVVWIPGMEPEQLRNR
ncbi:MAG: hypothetical protein AAF191_18180, partial [Verrucomicrobiota bacterium]